MAVAVLVPAVRLCVCDCDPGGVAVGVAVSDGDGVPADSVAVPRERVPVGVRGNDAVGVPTLSVRVAVADGETDCVGDGENVGDCDRDRLIVVDAVGADVSVGVGCVSVGVGNVSDRVRVSGNVRVGVRRDADDVMSSVNDTVTVP